MTSMNTRRKHIQLLKRFFPNPPLQKKKKINIRQSLKNVKFHTENNIRVSDPLYTRKSRRKEKKSLCIKLILSQIQDEPHDFYGSVVILQNPI